MDIYEALYTTRAMRRLRPDPIPYDVQARILDAAIRAPSGGNTQQWRFLLVDDQELKNQLGPLYRACMDYTWNVVKRERTEQVAADPDNPEYAWIVRMTRAVKYQADHWEQVPLFFFAFAKGDTTGSSIFPAVWSAMLAARAEGVGSTLTTVLTFREAEVFRLLGVPQGENWKMAACIPMGYPLGNWGVADRQPANEVAARNGWDGPLGFDIPAPLWKSAAGARA